MQMSFEKLTLRNTTAKLVNREMYKNTILSGYCTINANFTSVKECNTASNTCWRLTQIQPCWRKSWTPLVDRWSNND